MSSFRRLIPQGTLDLLILQFLSLGAAHGYAIAQRLEQHVWLEAQWRLAETGREAKFYSLTASGREQLVAERVSWARLTGAVQLILGEVSK